MNYTVLTYSIYLAVTILLTIWVARTLFTNGRIFLIEIFHQDTVLADSVNKLLLVGFYLVNIGYAVYTLKIHQPTDTTQTIIETLSLKIGWIILVLGGMHFFNLFILFSLRRKAQQTSVKTAAPRIVIDAPQ
jgi:p-aminobenzoyl-glutamate transporter AbgT